MRRWEFTVVAHAEGRTEEEARDRIEQALRAGEDAMLVNVSFEIEGTADLMDDYEEDVACRQTDTQVVVS